MDIWQEIAKLRLLQGILLHSNLRTPSLCWRGEEEKESSMISLCATKSLNLWHLDSGCSKHMIGDPRKFITLKDSKGKVTFEDSLSSKIIEKWTVVVDSKIKAENVLLVENIKPTLLNVIQTCDQGHICIFDSEKCEIKNMNSGKVVGIAIRENFNSKWAFQP